VLLAIGSSVLIVDRSDEVREVLRTALERRGLQIYDAARADQGLELARRHHPDLIVLDIDVEPHEAATLSDQFAESAGPESTPLIMLGTLRLPACGAGEFVSKPYHYQPLISKIEQMLLARGGSDTVRKCA